MPLFDEGGNTGASYQTAWEAFTGLFDKERRGKPKKQPDDEENQDGLKPLGKKNGKP